LLGKRKARRKGRVPGLATCEVFSGENAEP
jgi:hypothetical protein